MCTSQTTVNIETVCAPRVIFINIQKIKNRKNVLKTLTCPCCMIIILYIAIAGILPLLVFNCPNLIPDSESIFHLIFCYFTKFTLHVNNTR